MTREDIDRLAQEAGFKVGPSRDGPDDVWGVGANLERFFHMAQAAEREACAKVCEENATDLSEGDWDSACINCANHIRERGQQ